MIFLGIKKGNLLNIKGPEITLSLGTSKRVTRHKFNGEEGGGSKTTATIVFYYLCLNKQDIIGVFRLKWIFWELELN